MPPRPLPHRRPPLLAWAVAVALGPASACTSPKPAPAGVSATTMPQAAASARAQLRGEVREVLRAGPYTYARVLADDGEHWAVVMQAPPLATGQHIDLRVMGERADFESPRLGRRFERLFFTALAPGPSRAPTPEAKRPASPTQALPAGPERPSPSPCGDCVPTAH